MKKIFISFCILIILAMVGFGIALWQAPKIVSYLLSQEIGSKVTIETLKYKNQTLEITGFTLMDIFNKQSIPSVQVKQITIYAPLSHLLGKKLVVDEIIVNDIELNVLFYNATGTRNNWSEIMNDAPKEEKNNKQYLIRKLILNNLKVTVKQFNRRPKTYPVIKQLVFENISDETGFPVNRIEKAIFHTVIKSIFERFNLFNLIKSLNPLNIIPIF